MNQWKFGAKTVRAFGQGKTAVWLTMGHDEAAVLSERLGIMPVTLIAVEGVDWNHDLTPWPAPSIFRGQPDFGGGAEEYLQLLTEEIMPEVEKAIRPRQRWIAGYSLAGMFAVWAATKTRMFSAAASVSGSMWYKNYIDYLQKITSLSPVLSPEKAYFSLGDKERFGRNPAFKSIEECTKRAEEILRGKGVKTVYETNPGGHFDDPVGRMARAIGWLCGQQ